VESLKLAFKTSEITADKIFFFFKPLLSGQASGARADIYAKILELCKDAFKLRMAMRKSKEGYRCEILNTDKTCETLAESFGVENGTNNEASDVICYTLFGALTKHPEYRGERKKVLEKAQVILKRKIQTSA
jgi:hypothetical protein